MLPTFVIGLREGLEAALIVGIIAAFLRTQGRSDLLRWVFAGVGLAVLLCLGVGVALDVVSKDLPQRQQEGLETVVGALAVAMVTYMVVWMKRHSRELKGSLEDAAAIALADGSQRAGRALVVMAFLAVLREGFETVVFLLAAFNETHHAAPAVAGAVLGILVAVGLGWGIYRGGVNLNLSKFFRATGLVLVLVAAGLVLTAFHTAHEAGWINAGQGGTVNLTWLVRPGSVQASLLTGMLGVQPRPVVIEVLGWLAYLVPVGIYVAWPPGRSIAPRRIAVGAAVTGAIAGVASVVLVAVAPGMPTSRPVTAAGSASVRVVAGYGDRLTVQAHGLLASPAPIPTLKVRRVDSTTIRGLVVDRYAGTARQPFGQAVSSSMTLTAIARLNGGRLPLGIAAGGRHRIPVSYRVTTAATLLVEPRTLRVISARVSRQELATVHAAVGLIPLDQPVRSATGVMPAAATSAATVAAMHDIQQRDRRGDDRRLAVTLAVGFALLLLASGGFEATARRRRTPGLDHQPLSLIGHKVSLT